MKSFRVESDSMGEMRVPAKARYGAQTARAVENFPISGLRFPRPFIRALGLIKKHAAQTNSFLHILDPGIARAISHAATEVAEGKWDSEFVVDIFQTGSGTSTHMNANEVIASRAAELLKDSSPMPRVHPNDHVNQGQSSNDVIPSALHIAALEGIEHGLLPALFMLQAELFAKAGAFHEIIKIGRTHYQDATPVRLGQEFGGYAAQIGHGIGRLRAAARSLEELPLGGTAVGTGLNTHPEFAPRAIAAIANETQLPFREAANHFEAQGARDACVEVSGALKTAAVSLIKIAGDIRFMASGPRAGIGELLLPATQPGSSIMPGKVNPVMSEMLIQAGVQAVANDTAITWGGAAGHLELNVMMPLIAHNLLQSIHLLTTSSSVFARRCVAGIEADAQRCRMNIEQSLALCTALAPVIGYDRAAQIAKTAHETNRTVREVASEISGLTHEELASLLDPARQTTNPPQE